MRSLPDPGFAGDDGAVPAAVAEVLAAYGADPAGRLPALAVLQRARLLVPVVAVLGEVEHDERGLAREKSSDMATVLLRRPDGRSALLAFTGAEPMRRWDPAARPVPVPTRRVAEHAVSDGVVALLLDLAGPVTFVVREAELRSLAEGLVLTDLAGRYGWVRSA